MKIKPLKIGDITAKIPIIQGGMGVGISLSNLAGNVALEGGIGIISSAQIGFREKDFLTNTLNANLRAIKAEFEKARKIAPNGIIGFNIMVALNNYTEQVVAAVDAGADIIISGAGLPMDLPEYVIDTHTKIAPIVSSKKAANVILKYWDRKYAYTADLIVIEGPKAGGHLGFSKNEVKHINQLEYDNVIKDIILLVEYYEEKYNKKIPVVVAGGISDNKDVEHALKLGADGVQVATRFVTTKECDANEKYKQSYIDSKKEDIIIVDSPVGMPGRAIKNELIAKVYNGEKFSPSRCLNCLKKCNPKDIPYCITDRLIKAAKGQIDDALLFCGANTYKETKITSVKEVFESLIK